MGKTSSVAMLAMKWVDGDVKGITDFWIINQNLCFSSFQHLYHIYLLQMWNHFTVILLL